MLLMGNMYLSSSWLYLAKEQNGYDIASLCSDTLIASVRYSGLQDYCPAQDYYPRQEPADYNILFELLLSPLRSS
jgi:hypothetical protein